MELPETIDTEHCPTCREALDRRGVDPAEGRCGAGWPPSRDDVEMVRCRLPINHRSAEHWHPPLWGSDPVVWFLDA